MRRRALLPLLGLAAAAAPVSAAYVVTLAPSASADEQFAARTISEELGTKACGRALPVMAPNATAARSAVVLAVGAGALAALGRSGVRLPGQEVLGDEGYVLVGGGVQHNWMALSGRPGSPRGTAYAAVEFLEALGWSFLAWDCTKRPPTCPSALPFQNITRKPPQLAYRTLGMWQIQAGGDLFRVASHANPPPLDGGEGLGRFLPWSLSATHPEWFYPRPVSGQPPPTFWGVCWSNASLVSHVIAWVRAELTRKPATPFLEISPNDGPAHCQTPSEKQVNSEEGTDAGAFFRAINAIAAAIAPEHPGTKIVSLAYSWTQTPPQPLNSSRIRAMHPAVVPYFAPIGDNYAIPHLVPHPSTSSPPRSTTE